MAAGAEVAKLLRPGDTVALRGELGAGKTVFVRGAAAALGCREQVTSPTFAIVNQYLGRVPVFHFDMYRIEGEGDLYSTGYYDYLDGRSVLFIEWSENIAFALPEDTITVSIEKTPGGRRIEVAGIPEGRE